MNMQGLGDWLILVIWLLNVERGGRPLQKLIVLKEKGYGTSKLSVYWKIGVGAVSVLELNHRQNLIGRICKIERGVL
jgi:hypothetical protein